MKSLKKRYLRSSQSCSNPLERHSTRNATLNLTSLLSLKRKSQSTTLWVLILSHLTAANKPWEALLDLKATSSNLFLSIYNNNTRTSTNQVQGLITCTTQWEADAMVTQELNPSMETEVIMEAVLSIISHHIRLEGQALSKIWMSTTTAWVWVILATACTTQVEAQVLLMVLTLQTTWMGSTGLTEEQATAATHSFKILTQVVAAAPTAQVSSLLASNTDYPSLYPILIVIFH